MSSLALESQGRLHKIGNGLSSEKFATITEIKTFSGPGGSATVMDGSDLSSLAREKRMGLNDEGQLSFTINYIPTNTQHALLRTQRASRELTSFQLIFTDTGNTTWDFEAYVNGFSVSGAVDGVVEAQVTLEISGAITETP
jgi:hypothetical protein